MHARNINTCYVRRIDCRPTDNLRSVRVCVVCVPTSHAQKFCLAFTVSFIDAPALGTSPGCVARINEPNRDTSSFGFIQDKFLQLPKRPTMQTAALLFTSPYSTADAFEILKGNPAFGVFGSTNYLFRNLVVHVSREPSFFSPSTTNQTFGGLCAFLLEFSPQASVTGPATVHSRSSEPLAVRRFSYRDNTHVDANPSNRHALFLIRHVNRRKKEPFFVSVDQVCFSALKGKQFPVMVPAYEGNLLATVKRPNTREAFVHVPRQDAQIVRDRTVLAKFPLNLLINLVSVSNLGIQPDDNLGRQRKLIANNSVERLVHSVLTELLCFPSQFAQTITRRISHLKRTQQGIRLLWRWLQFYLSGQLDANNFIQVWKYTQQLTNTKYSIPLSAKAEGLLPKIL